MKEYEIMADCYSEKADIHVDFCIGFDSEDDAFALPEPYWIFEGARDTIYENSGEFETSIEKVERLLAANKTMSTRHALENVFGHFSITYKVDDIIKELSYDIDIDDLMYIALEDLFF